MTKVIVGMTVSIDGFAANRNGSASPLYPDLQDLRDTDHMQTRPAPSSWANEPSRWGIRTRTSARASSRCPSSC
jgi:hypothetical protein